MCGLRIGDLSVAMNGQPILASIDLHVRSSELTLLTGRSGAGKSTLINAILGLVPVARGSIELGGHDLMIGGRSGLSSIRRQIGIVYQDPLLLADLEVAENVVWMARLRGFSIRESRVRAVDALESVGIGHLASRRVHHLSGGEAQRVSLARATVGSPLVLLADEPTSSLDSDNSNTVGSLLHDLAGTLAIPVLVASHDPILADFADHTVSLSDGRLVEGSS